ncbi:serine/threonine protein kinase [Hyalangium minutum]|uniref:Serine/threonine kinase PKN11 n=1 Tax=Hyalangium minutum TaxID=394096 RepID=A0A085W3Z2_9BACT|nr:serine/threonine-protein kinase [Hyalangium minutum]KFE62405.1 serine/threonine kinase PKN11 [Hyalangium minutum]
MPSMSLKPTGPEVLLRSGRTSYEFVRWLGWAHHGELVLACRRFDEAFSGFSVIKRPVAPVSEEARRRLLDEGRVASQLHHPNILAALQLKGPEDVPHLVMEHVTGMRLSALLEAAQRAQQPLSEASTCHVVAEVADALHHAHSLVDEHGRALGIVHRDVSPHNILLGEHGEVKLLDFGAAWSRLSGRVSSEGPTVQGSLAYAAPEHAQHLALDARADQFSLGIILLQLLTGRHLFEGAERFDARLRRARAPESDATRKCAQDLAQRIRSYSQEDLEAATRAVPEALRSTVLRALAPERAARFASCGHLAKALREYLRDTGQYVGRHEVLTELVALRYVSLRVEAGETPDDAVRERSLPDPGLRSAPRLLAHLRAARFRGPPRRR